SKSTSRAPLDPWYQIFCTFQKLLTMRKRLPTALILGGISTPRIFNPCSALRTMLLLKVRSSVTDHGAVESWLLDFRRIAKPTCASGQMFSNTLPSIRTRRAFFVSSRFFTVQCLPAYDGWPTF